MIKVTSRGRVIRQIMLKSQVGDFRAAEDHLLPTDVVLLFEEMAFTRIFTYLAHCVQQYGYAHAVIHCVQQYGYAHAVIHCVQQYGYAHAVIHCVQQYGYAHAVIHAADTDILVMTIYHSVRIPGLEELWVQKETTFVPCHRIARHLAEKNHPSVYAATSAIL